MGPIRSGKSLFILWVMANSAGWVVGIVVVIVLGTLGESIHIGSNLYVGAGMGWTVGLAQWLIARKWFDATSRWMWASTIGITTPFLFADLIRMQDLSSFPIAILAAAGGLLTGLMQRNSLHSHSVKANQWAVVSIVAWMCPALLVEFGVVPRHPDTKLDAVRNFGSLGLGGVVLGTVTGAALVLLLNVRRSSSE